MEKKDFLKIFLIKKMIPHRLPASVLTVDFSPHSYFSCVLSKTILILIFIYKNVKISFNFNIARCLERLLFTLHRGKVEFAFIQ